MESTHHPFHSFYILYLSAHIYVSMCFNIYVSTEARVAGSCTSYGPDTVPFRPISHPTQACLHGALHHFFFQNFNMDTQLKITHYYPNLELNNITAR